MPSNLESVLLRAQLIGMNQRVMLSQCNQSFSPEARMSTALLVQERSAKVAGRSLEVERKKGIWIAAG